MNYQLAFQILLPVCFLAISILLYVIKKEEEYIKFLEEQLSKYNTAIDAVGEILSQ